MEKLKEYIEELKATNLKVSNELQSPMLLNEDQRVRRILAYNTRIGIIKRLETILNS